MKSAIRRGTTRGLVFLVVIAIAMAPTAAPVTTSSEQIVMLVPNIPGSSMLPGHLGWIDLISFAGNAVAPPAPGAFGPPCQMTVQKPLDKASPHLWVATVTGQIFSNSPIKIQLFRTGITGAPFEVYDIELTNAEITSIGDSSSNALPLESLTLKATSVTLTFVPENLNGTPGNPVTTTFRC